jgi:hypothetical protein
MNKKNKRRTIMTLLQQLIILVVLYICAYSLVDRICKCIEHCASAKGYAKLEEAKILAKDRSKESNYVE